MYNKARLGRVIIGMVSLTILLNDCSPKQVAKPEVSAPETTRQTTVPSQQSIWTPMVLAGNKHYFIEDSSTISINDDSSHVTSFQMRTFYSLSLITLGDSLVLTAIVDSTSTNPLSSSGKSGPTSQVIHAIASNAGQLSGLTSETVTACKDGIEAVGMRIYELIPSYPKHSVERGGHWVDTVSANSCRGKTSLHQRIIREYQFLGFSEWKEYNAARIERHSSNVVTGSTLETRNRFTATGSGTGSAILYVDRKTGRLLESDGHSESKLIISTTRGDYPFTQSIITHIEARY